MSSEKNTKKKPQADTQRSKPGPEAERLKIDGDWEDAAKKLIRKKDIESGKG